MSVPLWFSNLVFWSAQVAVLVLAAGLLVQLLRVRQPRVLLVLWRALLLLSLLLPLLEPWHRSQTIAALPITPDPTLVSTLQTHSRAHSHWQFPAFTLAEILGVVILIGIAVRLAVLVLGLFKLRQFRQISSPLPVDPDFASSLEQISALVGARAELCLSASAVSPVTFGFSRPLILLPERFLRLQPRLQLAIACHELLHVRRHDWAHHFAEEILSAFLWFHPAVAWLIGRVRLAREQVVDLEVVQITESRKPYLQALLEFTSERGAIAAIPAPPFLVERQLAQRAALILKEVRMSRKRLMASLATLSGSVALTAVLVAWAFPLKASPHSPRNPLRTAIAQAPSSDVIGGVIQGVSGGDANEPTVDSSTLWLATVKRNNMILRVRGLGKLVRADGPTNLLARVDFAEVQAVDIKVNQIADVTTKHGVIGGHVVSVSPHISLGMRSVDVAFDAPLPKEAVADDPIEGTIDVGRIENALVVGRPIHTTANSQVSLFKVIDDGAEAEKVNVRVGRVSVTQIEVAGGLNPGDTIILSDMSQWARFDRVRLQPPIKISSRQ